jgi:hypothetical protein
VLAVVLLADLALPAGFIREAVLAGVGLGADADAGAELDGWVDLGAAADDGANYLVAYADGVLGWSLESGMR